MSIGCFLSSAELVTKCSCLAYGILTQLLVRSLFFHFFVILRRSSFFHFNFSYLVIFFLLTAPSIIHRLFRVIYHPNDLCYPEFTAAFLSTILVVSSMSHFFSCNSSSLHFLHTTLPGYFFHNVLFCTSFLLLGIR